MKKTIKIVDLSFTTVLCCLILVLNSNILVSADNAYSHSNQLSHVGDNITLLSGYLYSQITNGQEINNGLTNLPSLVRSNHPFNLASSKKVLELFYTNKYLRYVYYATSFIISLKPPDIIFPFNYFW